MYEKLIFGRKYQGRPKVTIKLTGRVISQEVKPVEVRAINPVTDLSYAPRTQPLPPVMRGDIFYADLSPVVGSEQGGIRPVLIVQNNVGNKHSPTVIAAAITSQINKARLPTHIELNARTYGLSRDSVVLLEQIRTLDKRRLKERMGRLDESLMRQVDSAISVSFGLA
ncbi:hypothetical protein FACS1894202_03110 [Clostridia bacterium]|nr:hypothetical protein FACS1894202_03110 [Clostridia bacterium]